MRGRRRRPDFACLAESLEPRHLLASDVITGGLLFRGDFTGSGGNIVTDGTVQVGYAPTTGEAFRSLVTLTGDITVDASTATLGFKGTASVIQGDGSLPLWSTATVASYSIADLLGGGTAISGMSFTVDGLSFTASSLRFENPDGGSTSDARLATQGRLSAAAIAGFAVDVGVENAVRIDLRVRHGRQRLPPRRRHDRVGGPRCGVRHGRSHACGIRGIHHRLRRPHCIAVARHGGDARARPVDGSARPLRAPALRQLRDRRRHDAAR
jgi:hypothetical protein